LEPVVGGSSPPEWGLEQMSGDLVSVRILAAFGSPADRDLLRQAAAMAPILIDVIEAENADAARRSISAGDIDVVFIEGTAASTELKSFLTAAKSAPRPPFVIIVASAAWDASEFKTAGVTIDGVVAKPARIEQARVLINRCIRLRLPSRCLVVDDSATQRRIVRKLLTGIRFPLDISEAEDGIDALKQLSGGKFDFVFLDYNMPGLNGLETLSEIKRLHPSIQVVLMTSAEDEALIKRAQSSGAAALLRKPFYPADIDAVLQSIYGLRASAKG
jgi:CheY-like chemotaxis protein